MGERAGHGRRPTWRSWSLRAIVFVVIAATCLAAAACGPTPTRQTPSSSDSRDDRSASRTADGVDSDGPVWRIVGTSVEGRPIVRAGFGHGGRHIVYVGGIHGHEHGDEVADALASFLASHPESVPAGAEIHVLTCANPDGRALDRGSNARRVDLNRNFPTEGWRAEAKSGRTSGTRPASEPETRALLEEIDENVDVVVSLHSQGGLFDPDGPGAEAVASRMASHLDWPVMNTGGDSDLRGSLGHYVAERLGKPAVTVELEEPSLTPSLTAALLEAAR